MAHGGRYGRLLKHGMHNDMMNGKTVNAWLEMAQDDEVLVAPDDINQHTNLCAAMNIGRQLTFGFNADGTA